MKKWFIVIIAMALILSLFSCDDIYDETIITDIKEYSAIWSLPERRVNEKSELFPFKIDEEQCVEFICKHTTYKWVGTGWQVLLKIVYDDTEFISEMNRLTNLCANSYFCGNSEYFDFPRYATAWNWQGCFEYAIVDNKNKAVCYVYLQLIDKDDLILEKKYIPRGYETQLNNSVIYSIYEK